MIQSIDDPAEKQAIAREILSDLPDWFGIPEATEQYIREAAEQTVLAAMVDGSAVGFLTLKETGRSTVKIAVMGVKRAFHRQGIGKRLILLRA